MQFGWIFCEPVLAVLLLNRGSVLLKRRYCEQCSEQCSFAVVPCLAGTCACSMSVLCDGFTSSVLFVRACCFDTPYNVL